jgi:glutamate-1-semialdehyde aminotransferase
MPYLVFTYDNQNWFTDTGPHGKPIMDKGSRAEIAWRTFYTGTTRGGVLFHPNHHWFVSAAHTDADLEQTLSVSGDASAAIRTAL